MTPISKPALSVGTIVALALLAIIAVTIAWHYRAVHGFRDLIIFIVVMGGGWWAVNHDWHKKA